MAEVKTTFAAHGNPWAQLIKEEREKMTAQKKPATKPAAKPAAPNLSAAQMRGRIDVDSLTISDMPYPGRTVPMAVKYNSFFEKLAVNRRVVCEIADTNTVSNALAGWVKKHKPGHLVRSVTDCGDGKGGCWILRDEK